MKTVDSFDFSNKKALVRVDFNVPLNDRLEITDDTRIKATIPTIKKILTDGGSCILIVAPWQTQRWSRRKIFSQTLSCSTFVDFGRTSEIRRRLYRSTSHRLSR